MDDLDKMARELLAAEYDRDRPGSEVARKLRGHLVGQLRTADTVALSAIRAALLTAPPGCVLMPGEASESEIKAAAYAIPGAVPTLSAAKEIARKVRAYMIAARPGAKP